MSRSMGKDRVRVSSEESRARPKGEPVDTQRRQVTGRVGNWLDLGKLRSREGLWPTGRPKVECCRQGGSAAARPTPKQLGLGSSR